MGVKIREKPKGSGVWWIFINHQGKRKSKRIGDKRTAKEVAKKIEAKLALGEFRVLDEQKKANFKAYAEQWLEGYVKAALKYSTYFGYKGILKHHLIPKFGNKILQDITRADVKQFLFDKLNTGLSSGRVKRISASLSGIFRQAIEDGEINVNPCTNLGWIFSAKDQGLNKDIFPYTAAELEKYLETCQKYFPKYYPLFLTLARTGVRLGEVLGMQWGDIDFEGKFIEVKRAIVKNKITTTKSGKSRRVEMTPYLAMVLKEAKMQCKKDTLKHGWKQVPEWVFYNEEGKPIDQGNLRGRIHYKACERAGLRRIRIHDLRHSYATIRITAGHNIADVSKQLGHASYKITVDTYDHWLPNQARNEVEELDQLGKDAPKRTLSAPKQKKESRHKP